MIKIYGEKDSQSFLDSLTKYKIMHYFIHTQNLFWKFHFYHILSVRFYTQKVIMAKRGNTPYIESQEFTIGLI